MAKRLLVSSALAAALWAAGTTPTARAAAKPNVLFIAVDDLNHWVGYLGRNKQTITPNIDRLAARGVRFSRSYCAAPVCNPSRAALMSGMRPSTTGVYDNSDDWRSMIPQDLTLTSTFRKAGYRVMGAGKIYHDAFKRRGEWDDYLAGAGKDPLPQGNDGVGVIKFAPLDAKDEDLSDWKIVQYGIDQLGRKQDKPFFLAIGLHKPHMPWNVPRKYYDMHPLDKIQLPPTLDRAKSLLRGAVNAGPPGPRTAPPHPCPASPSRFPAGPCNELVARPRATSSGVEGRSPSRGPGAASPGRGRRGHRPPWGPRRSPEPR